MNDDPDARSPAADPGGPAIDRDARDAAGFAPSEYARAFSIVAFTMNRFVIDQVLRASRFFDADVEAMLIFGILAHLNVAHLLNPGARPSGMLGVDGRIADVQPKLRAVRLRDLVQVTGRPRETLRRKLEQLLAAGWIHRVDDGWVFNPQAIGEDMRDQGIASARRLLQAADAIRTALEDAQAALPPGTDGSRQEPPRG